MMGVSHMPMFFDQDAIVMIRHILLLMLCRNERKRAVMKTDTGYLCVEPVPEDIASGQVLVILAKEIDETYDKTVHRGDDSRATDIISRYGLDKSDLLLRFRTNRKF